MFSKQSWELIFKSHLVLILSFNKRYERKHTMEASTSKITVCKKESIIFLLLNIGVRKDATPDSPSLYINEDSGVALG